VQSFTVYPNPVCINRTTAVTYTGTGFPNALILGFNGGTVVSGSGQGPYEVMWTTGGTKTVTLDVNDNGCIAPQISQQVTINNNPVADAGPDITVCSGGTVQIEPPQQRVIPTNGFQPIIFPTILFRTRFSRQ